MQQWQFKQELAALKKDLIKNSTSSTDWNYIDSKTDEFLEQHGIRVNEEDEEIEADVQNDSLY